VAADLHETVYDASAVADAATDASDGAAATDLGAAACPGGARCPCASAADCDSAWCLAGRDGTRCAANCTGGADCQPDEACVLAGGGDLVSVCVPRWASLCAPCGKDNDCRTDLQSEDVRCVEQGSAGRFCTAVCDAKLVCPNGFSCSGGSCQPAGGPCTCSAWAATYHKETLCNHTNGLGKCSATVRCDAVGPLPVCLAADASAETCNGQDDDCDGMTDDGGEASCGDGDPCTADTCQGGTCHHDANTLCGDGSCASVCGETPKTCSADCHTCGDGVCSPGENPKVCSEDCCGACGDGLCKGYACGENPSACPADCGNACGNQKCEKGESPSTCPGDCVWQVCGNGVCEPEDGGPDKCPNDCGNSCGNCACEKGEGWLDCPVDCGWCGDGICSSCASLGESAATCPADCESSQCKQPGGCDDGVDCTLDLCGSKGKCIHVDDKQLCEDGSACTADDCDVMTGACAHLPVAATCSDGDVCSVGDTCGEGLCLAGAATVCDDGNVCTTELCMAQSGCVFLANGKKCEDGSVCTVGDVCGAKACLPGAVTSCEDGNACTEDSCDGKLGCQHADTTAGCEDGDACTAGDACGGGSCGAGSAVKCDDGNACTDDSCLAESGCLFADNTVSCDDGDACTTAEVCAGGTCAGKPISCDDGNGCTTDSCASATGCQHSNVADWTACGEGLVCDGSGVCQDVKTAKGMAFIPSGTFWMGCNSTKDTNCDSNANQHKVTLSSYYIDLTETTVGQYKACVDASVCTTPSSVQPFPDATYPGLTNNPVNFVSWTQSQQYCKWRGAAYDLPTEAQWEMAARGDCVKNGKTAGEATCVQAMRTYPWGDATATCSYAVMYNGTRGCGTDATWAVGSIPGGDSPYGLHDMAGNVWEWCRDWYGSYGSGDQTDPTGPGSAANRINRGGSFDSGGPGLRASSRNWNAPSFGVFESGLRCSRSYP